MSDPVSHPGTEPSRQHVLEVVHLLDQTGEPLAISTLAERLHVSATAAELILNELAADGLVESDLVGGMVLAEAGRQAAVSAVRRHALTERLLLDVIGVDWSRVHLEAERWGDIISDEVEARLVDLLGDPGTCAHGNPIPGSRNRPDHSDAVPLAEAPAGPVTVVRIIEELEEDQAALELLERCGATPGRPAEVIHRSDEGVHVVGSRDDAVIPSHVAAGTFVQAR